MVRVSGMTYACAPGARMGSRITDMRIRGRPLEAEKRYKVAGWAPVAEGASGEPIWDLVARQLRARKRIGVIKPQRPRLIDVQGNPGIA